MEYERKAIVVVCDGMGDRPCSELDDRTPLEAADTPNLDRLAEEGVNGIMDTIGTGVRPGSDTAHLSIFGYDPREYYSGRGPFEAAGAGMDLKTGDIAFRGNFATVDGEMVVRDRRAGRIGDVSQLCEAINGLEIDGVKFLAKAGTAYRAGVVLRGENLSHEIGPADPHEEGVRVLEVEPLDDSPEAEKTADLLNRFLKKAHQILKEHPLNKDREENDKLPANFLLVRGAGELKHIPSMKEHFGVEAACIAGAGLYKGVAKVCGMDLIDVEGATGRPDTDVNAKMKKARQLVEETEYEYFFVHVKGTDIFGHDDDPAGKKKFIEKIDEGVGELIGIEDTYIAFTADHSTPCEMKNHSGDPVPLLIWGPSIRTDEVTRYGERPCMKGGLHRIRGLDLMPEILNLIGKSEIYGA